MLEEKARPYMCVTKYTDHTHFYFYSCCSGKRLSKSYWSYRFLCFYTVPWNFCHLPLFSLHQQVIFFSNVKYSPIKNYRLWRWFLPRKIHFFSFSSFLSLHFSLISSTPYSQMAFELSMGWRWCVNKSDSDFAQLKWYQIIHLGTLGS